MDRFWIVMRNMQQLTASVRHPSREEAIAEAKRLAKQHPNNQFFVAAITGFAHTKPKPVELDEFWVEMERNRKLQK